ncbi:MAG: cadherin-like domain-containing protein, partial [Leptothrix sp. (in: b-proteobacteria)]
MATSTTLIAGSTAGFSAVQTSSIGGTVLSGTTSYSLPTYTSISIADYNGDGKLDIVGYGATSAFYMAGTGTGTFGTLQTATLATAQPLVVAAAGNASLEFSGGWSPDVNGDGTADTLTFTASTVTSGTTSVSFNYSFQTAAQTYTIGHPVWSNAIADINGDGLTDLVFLNADNSISVLLANDPAATPVSVNEDTALAVNLVGYSYSTTGTTAMAGFHVSTLPANGTLYADAALTQAITTATTIAGTGGSATVYFKPNLNWNGSTSLSYVAVDAAGNTSVTAATQAITVVPVNDAPALTAAAATLAAGTEDVAYTVTAAQLLTGWTDVDGNTL